jgi:hypothetical protein
MFVCVCVTVCGWWYALRTRMRTRYCTTCTLNPHAVMFRRLFLPYTILRECVSGVCTVKMNIDATLYHVNCRFITIGRVIIVGQKIWG